MASKTMTYSLFGLNVVQLIFALAILTIGIITLTDRTFRESYMGNGGFSKAGHILVIVAVVIILISFLGCYGAIKEVKWMLLTYLIILIVLFVILFIGCVLAFFYRDNFDTQMKKGMERSIPLYMNDTVVTEAWDSVQESFKCCGLSTEGRSGYEVWQQRNPNFQSPTQVVPDSCCPKKDTPSLTVCRATPVANAHSKDCFEELKGYIKHHAAILGGVCIVVACILVVEIILACALHLRG